jgi:hypothetical protein
MLNEMVYIITTLLWRIKRRDENIRVTHTDTPKYRWQDNIKKNLKETQCHGEGWVRVLQDRKLWKLLWARTWTSACEADRDDLSLAYSTDSRKKIPGRLILWGDTEINCWQVRWDLNCTVLYCTVLHCTVLYCTVLCCTVLYCTVLYCTTLHCTVLYCTVFHCTVLHCTVRYSTVLYCTVLYCTILYCTVLYSTVLCCTVLCCTVLYCTVLYCTVLYSTVLYCTVQYCTVWRDVRGSL